MLVKEWGMIFGAEEINAVTGNRLGETAKRAIK